MDGVVVDGGDWDRGWVVRADLWREMVEREGAKESKARDSKAKQKIISE